MTKYPIGIQTFEKIREGGYLYIDKTQYIYDIANSYQYVFLSRPRRFGKSLLTSTFEAYFSGRKELFKGLAIEKQETQWTAYPVLHFDLSTAKLGTVENLNAQLGYQLGQAEQKWGMPYGGDDYTARLQALVEGIYAKTGVQVVVLIDEYDAPMLSVMHDEDKLDAMRTALQAFYSPLKKLDPCLRFVFITGITKFSQLSIFSQINNLEKISMKRPFAALCGITQEELETNFGEGIARLGEEWGLTRDEVLMKLREKYDGYHFAHNSPGVYNPFSLLSAMKDCEFENYWFSTGTPRFLISQIKKFHADITHIDGSVADATEFDAPTEDMHSILPLFYQSGYLTIKDYDRVFQAYTLGYPNEEVKVGLTQTLIPYYVSPDINSTHTACRNMSKALMNDDIDSALAAAQSFFASIPYQEGTLKDAPTTEGHFTAMLYVMFSFLNKHVFSQVRVARGRMDILVTTERTVYVMELKIDGSVDEALKQIDDKGYAIAWQADGRRVVRVGINFSTQERTITEWKAI